MLGRVCIPAIQRIIDCHHAGAVCHVTVLRIVVSRVTA